MFKRFILLLLAGIATTSAARDVSLDGAEVTLPFRELQKILDAKPAAPRPLLSFAILSASYTLDIEDSLSTGTATFVIQTFGESEHLIPLFDANLIVRTKDDVPLVVNEGRKALLVSGAKRFTSTFNFSLVPEKADDSARILLPIPAAATGELTITSQKAGASIAVSNAIYDRVKNVWLLNNSDKLDVTLRSEFAPPLVARIALPAVVREASSHTRVVRDGATLNKTTWHIAHGEALTWRLQLPVGSNVVACMVNEKPAEPTGANDGELAFLLPASDTATQVTVSYTAQTQPFAPVRGDFGLTLPTTDLLIERLDWKITLPTAYEPIALEGNADSLPSEQRNEILLRKELLRNAAATVRVFYQKPETTKKP